MGDSSIWGAGYNFVGNVPLSPQIRLCCKGLWFCISVLQCVRDLIHCNNYIFSSNVLTQLDCFSYEILLRYLISFVLWDYELL